MVMLSQKKKKQLSTCLFSKLRGSLFLSLRSENWEIFSLLDSINSEMDEIFSWHSLQRL